MESEIDVLSKELKEYSKLAVVSMPEYVMDELIGWFAQCLIEKGYRKERLKPLDEDKLIELINPIKIPKIYGGMTSKPIGFSWREYRQEIAKAICSQFGQVDRVEPELVPLDESSLQKFIHQEILKAECPEVRGCISCSRGLTERIIERFGRPRVTAEEIESNLITLHTEEKEKEDG